MARLRQLWDEAHSTSEIGRRLETTKNAVIGKARTLALPGRPSPIRRGGPAPERQARQEAPAWTPPPVMPAGRAALAAAEDGNASPAAASVTVASLEPRAWPTRELREYRWQIGEPRTVGFRLCGAPTLGRGPYCEAHSQGAYVLAQPGRSNGSLERDAAKQD